MIRAILYIVISIFIITFIRLVIGMIMRSMREMMSAPVQPGGAATSSARSSGHRRIEARPRMRDLCPGKLFVSQNIERSILFVLLGRMPGQVCRMTSFRDQFPRALRIVWLIIGFVSGFAVISPFLVALLSHFSASSPICAAKAAGGQCLLCGMTTAFVQIGGGDLDAARQANGGSLFLYTALALNFVAVLGVYNDASHPACKFLA